MITSDFAISWIYQEFHACRLQHGTASRHWTAPYPVTELAEFNRALVQAGEELGMHRGGTLAITYESDQHLHRFLDLPPLGKRDLERHLMRRAAQEKPFTEEAAHGYSVLNSTRFGTGALLHLLPRPLLDAIIRICQENHLVPVRLVSLTDVVRHHVASRGLPEEDIILVVALFDGRVELVAATGRGEGLFVRELQFDWRGEQVERLRLDIERTLLYLKQRQQIVEHLLFMGAGAETAIDALRAEFTLPLETVNNGTEPWFWAHAASLLPRDVASNLIPKHVRNAVRTQRILHGSSWIAVAAVLSAIVISATVEYLRWQQRQTDPSWAERYSALRLQRDEYRQREEMLHALEQQLADLTPDRQNVPAQFLARLGTIVPSPAFLQHAEISWDADEWRFKIEGGTHTTMADAITTLESIERNLEAAPWHGVVSDSWRTDWLERLRNGGATDSGLVGFRLDGTL